MQKILLRIQRLLEETGHNIFTFDKKFPEFSKSDYQELESHCLVRRILDSYLDNSLEGNRLLSSFGLVLEQNTQFYKI